jgi:hypothetical protein
LSVVTLFIAWVLAEGGDDRAGARDIRFEVGDMVGSIGASRKASGKMEVTDGVFEARVHPAGAFATDKGAKSGVGSEEPVDTRMVLVEGGNKPREGNKSG